MGFLSFKKAKDNENMYKIQPGEKYIREHEFLNNFLSEMNEINKDCNYSTDDVLKRSECWKKIEESASDQKGRILIAIMIQQLWYFTSVDKVPAYHWKMVTERIMKDTFTLGTEDIPQYLLYFQKLVHAYHHFVSMPLSLKAIVSWHNNLNSTQVTSSIIELAESLKTHKSDEVLQFRNKLLKNIDVAPKELTLRSGEVWSDAVYEDINSFDEKLSDQWIALLEFCATADESSPKAKWIKELTELLNEKAISSEEFTNRCLKWLPLVNQPAIKENKNEYGGIAHPLRIASHNQNVLKGLIWASTLVPNSDVGRAISSLAINCYNKKIPGEGPRAPKVGNACVWALGQFEGMQSVTHLSYMKVRVRNGSAQKLIEKTLNARAERMGMSREDLDEIGVSDYGLTAVGEANIPLGDCHGVIKIEGTNKVTLFWINNKGKPQKSVPSEVADWYKDELKEIKGAVADILKMLPAQRDRIDGLFLQQKAWSFNNWNERYCNHPLVGTLARRLIWELHAGNICVAFVPHEGRLLQLDGSEITEIKTDSQVKLWHPINSQTNEVLAWRDQLAKLDIVQPFKQAHREVYLLTDAERNTAVYSNRFAAHVIRQHQFNALCSARGWKNKLRLMVDDEYPPAYKELSQYGLRVEYWVEGVGDDYGVDTNDSGTYLYLGTDQVRYYRIDSHMNSAHASGGGYRAGRLQQQAEEPVRLEDVPPLVLSETMRDIDLFVGVGSIGNDPNWMDGGRAEQHNAYWNSYSFGDLTVSAINRKAILETIIPRLKIASRCRFDDRFLRVQGDIREYKIHLGSGNIQMEPNNQYLCIVPKQSSHVSGEKIMLPFEGDNTMSIILSKALLLAEDKKIKDPSIVNQIQRK